MGLSRMSGPVYGAKGLLWVFGPVTGSTGATTSALAVNSIRVVPNYEDWFITEAHLICSTNSSVASAHAVYLKTEGGVTLQNRPDGKGSTNAATILSMVMAAGSTTWSTWATATASAGEYEGTWCPAGSTIRIVSSGASAPAGVQVQVMGYIRYCDSTRAS